MSNKVDHEEYNLSYQKIKKEASASDVEIDSRESRAFDLIRHGLLRTNHKDNMHDICMLNIGPGPSDVTANFISAFVDICKVIVLIEINPYYCQDYRKCEWYLENKEKIMIECCDIEKYLSSNKNSNDNKIMFDIIYCNHMIYHFRLNYISVFLKQLNMLVKANYGFIVIGISDDNGNAPKYVQRVLKPKYQLSHYLEKCLNESKSPWFMIQNLAKTPMTYESCFALLTLFAKQDLYYNQDYHPSGVITNKDEIDIKNAIKNGISKVLIKDEETNQLLFHEITNFYFIKRLPNNNGKL